MTKINSKITQPDIGLIERCKLGDTNAFRTLVERMQVFAYNLAFRILLNEENAKDVVQDSFIKIWKNLPDYKPKYLFSTWMYKIVVNTCLDKLKSERKHTNFADDAGIYSTNIEEVIMYRDLATQIKKLSQDLPAKQKVIFVLSDLQDFTIEEISQVLNISKSLVKSNLYYARRNIREKFLKLEERRVYEIVH
jgi:RNA polymerase sigma-70 factor, ECF subfamily